MDFEKDFSDILDIGWSEPQCSVHVIRVEIPSASYTSPLLHF